MSGARLPPQLLSTIRRFLARLLCEWTRHPAYNFDPRRETGPYRCTRCGEPVP